MDAKHTIHAHQGHLGWDRANPPVLTVAPGDTVRIECREASGGQLSPESTAGSIRALDFSKANPVTGPIAVDGAEPGDAIAVTLLDFIPVGGWGWTALIPGFGLLADQFPDPALHIWRYETGAVGELAAFGAHARVPLKPFAGTIGLALAEPGTHSVIPPRRVGGNMDIRDLAAGSTVWLPVEVAGGLLSIGDTHAGQGDGEVCGTAIESPLTVVCKVELEKGAAPPFPRFRTPGPTTRHLDAKGYEVTTGVGPDLMTGARDAVSAMIDRLAARHGLAPADAYMLCSVCGDLRISEIVDVPSWIVSFYFPRAVLD